MIRCVCPVVLAVKAVGGSLAESGRVNSTAEQIQRTSQNSSALAAESLQVQRQAFLSVILSYLSKPEDNPAEVSDESIDRSDEVTTKNDLKTAGQSWSQFADSSIHLRVLRSTSEPEARALFFRRRASNPPNNPPRRHQLATRPSTAVGQPVPSELTDLFDDLQRGRNQQFVNGEAEETSATIEVVQTRTPFVITSNGQMIMNDLPMVF